MRIIKCKACKSEIEVGDNAIMVFCKCGWSEELQILEKVKGGNQNARRT